MRAPQQQRAGGSVHAPVNNFAQLVNTASLARLMAPGVCTRPRTSSASLLSEEEAPIRRANTFIAVATGAAASAAANTAAASGRAQASAGGDRGGATDAGEGVDGGGGVPE